MTQRYKYNMISFRLLEGNIWEWKTCHMEETFWQQTQGLRTIGYGWHGIIRKKSNTVSKLCTPSTWYYGMAVFLIAYFDVSQTLSLILSSGHWRKTRLENRVKLWYLRVLLLGFTRLHVSFVFKYDSTSQMIAVLEVWR